MNRPVPLYLTLADECFEVIPPTEELREFVHLFVIQTAYVHGNLQQSGKRHRTNDLVKALNEMFFPEGSDT
jgi:hypothetical protein